MYKQSLFGGFLYFSEVPGLFDDRVSEVNGIPVPIHPFGLPQEEKSIAGERLFFCFLKRRALCLLASDFVFFFFKKRAISARDLRRWSEGGLEINSDKWLHIFLVLLQFIFPFPRSHPSSNLPSHTLSGLIVNGQTNAPPKKPTSTPIPVSSPYGKKNLQTESFIFFLPQIFVFCSFFVSQPPTVGGK